MARTKSSIKSEIPKFLLMGIFLILALISTYYLHYWVVHNFAISIHLFYIPIILACIWWKEKGILVALFLGVNIFISHIFYELHAGEILASAMFILIALLIVELGRKTGKAEKEIKIWHENFDQIFSAAGNGLLVIDKDFNIMQFNNSFLDLVHLTKDDVIGKKCFEVFPCAYCHTPNCTLKQILNKKGHVERVTEKELINGTKLSCIQTATPFWGSDGELIGIVEDFKDITDLVSAEKALKESELKYRSFVKNFKGIAYQSNLDFSFIFCHGAVEQITGYTEDDLVEGNPRWEQIIHRDDLNKILRNSKKLYKDKNCVCERQYRILRKDGQVRWIEEIIHNVCDKSGKPVLIEGIIYDITDRKLTEENLHKIEKEFLQAQKMEAVGRLAGGISHDFNNILTIINGNSSLLLDELKKDDPLRVDIEEIYKAGEHASLFINKLMAFSRRQVLQPKILDLNHSIIEIQGLLKHLMGENIEFVTILDPKLMRIKADSGQIEQVIMNLAVNARDAMSNGGAFIIKTENVTLDNEEVKFIQDARPGRYVRLSIEDSGIGMDKDILEHIFEPFFTTKKPGEGTGLGLSTIYGIVKQHEGWINVNSEPGYGSLFEIYLPALSVKHPIKAQDTISSENFHGNGERILVVEDEEGVRRFTKKALEKNGYKIFEAANALDALRIFDREQGDFHLVLSDVVLPDINGIQLAEQLKAKNTEILVILCSGYTYVESQWSVLNQGKFHFIKKPYNTLILLRNINEVIESKKKEGLNKKMVASHINPK